MVVDKTFTEKLVKNCNENKCVWRIMRMDDIEALGKENTHREKEAKKHGITVLPNVGEETIGIRWRRIAINTHAIDRFAERLSFVDRTDNCHLIAGCAQRVGFPADSQVLRVRPILQQHQDPITG